MAIKLEKSQGINLSKTQPSLKTVRAELKWSTPANKFPKFDLDVSMFGLTNAGGKPQLIDEDYFMFYNHNNKADDKSPIVNNDGALSRSPDELTGGAEWVKVTFDKVRQDCDELSVIITIHDAHKRQQTFNYVTDAEIRLFNDDTNEEIAFYDLDEQFGKETGVQIGSFVRKGAEWEFNAVGVGYDLELGDFVAGYTS